MRSTHPELVKEVITILGAPPQHRLADMLNECRRNTTAPPATQATISKWVTGRLNVNPDYAMTLHRLTGGEVSFFGFYPELAKDLQLKPLKRLTTRERVRTGKGVG